MKPSFAFLAPNDRHAFVTLDDIQVGADIQKALNELNAQHHSVMPAYLMEGLREARDEYSSAPTKRNFDALKTASIEAEFFRLHTNVRTFVHAAVDNLLADRFAPWMRAIIERALKAARERAEIIRELERKRIIELTGESTADTNSSPVIQHALQPIKQLLALFQTVSESQINLMAYRYDGPKRVLLMFGFEEEAATWKAFNLPAKSARIVQMESAFGVSAPNTNGAGKKEEQPT